MTEFESTPSIVNSGPDDRLGRRARRILTCISLPLFLVVLGLAAFQYCNERQQLMNALVTSNRTYVISLDGVAKLASDHVLQMQSWSRAYFERPPTAPNELRQLFRPLGARGGMDGYTIVAPPPANPGLVGQILWADDHPFSGRAREVGIDHALAFFSVVRLAHEVTPYFRWSYFFSADQELIAIYPWVAVKDIMRTAGADSQETMLRKGFTYEVAYRARPEANPTHSLYWTAPYDDEGGAGVMVSLGAPVYASGAFVGNVGTDLTLRTLGEFLQGLPREFGRLRVVDDNDRVLVEADAGPAKGADDLVRVGGNDTLTRATTQAKRAVGTVVHSGGWVMVANRVSHAPWTLVYCVSEQQMSQLLLPRLVPYGVILAALTLTLIVALYLLKRELIGPALSLARYIQRSSIDRSFVPPRLPRHWQLVANRVAQALESNRLAARRLRESEEFKSAILDNAMLAVITVDHDGTVVEFNGTASAIFRLDRSLTIGQGFTSLLIPATGQEEFRETWLEATGAADRREALSRSEFLAERSDGTLLSIEMSVCSTMVKGAQFYTAFLADVTARKEAEAELARQREALRQSEKLSAMGALLTGLAHELNNPLAILMGRAETLAEKAADSTLAQDALKIREAASRCRKIVRTFLATMRQEPAHHRVSLLGDVVTGAVDLVAYNLRRSGVELLMELDKSLEPICMDPDQIGQILVNLLINAEQALQGCKGPARIVLSTGRHRGEIWLRVADNGPGVPAELRARVFDSFFTTKSVGMGTGVGLSISRKIARDHGGDLVLVSGESGAVFELRLPVTISSASSLASIGMA